MSQKTNKSNGEFTIGIIQHACSADVAENLKLARAKVGEAAAKGAKVICLQELFGSRYFCSTEAHENFSLAEDLDGPTVSTFRKAAKELDVAIVVPFFERRAAGVYHNSAAVVDAGGELLGVYRKMHIPDDPLYFEKFYFTPGDAEGAGSGFKVFQTKYAKVGVLICWDQWYPEGARITSLMGAEVLFFPTAIGWHPKEKSGFGKAQVEAWQTIQRSHAVANGVYVASPNRIGLEPTPGTEGIEFFGNSFIVGPFGSVVASASSDKEEILIARCERTELEEVRQHWPFLRDRRIDAYGPITSRFIDR